MLNNSDKKKIEAYIDKIINEIKDELRIYSNTKSEQEVMDHVIAITINKFTPQSKMLLSSVYNMLADNTLNEPIFADVNCKTAFYERDILKELTNKFSFEVPSKIDLEENKKMVNEWIAGGSVVIVGGVISISFKSVIPVGIAAVLAAIMIALLKGRESQTKNDVDALIAEYLIDVKKSLMLWIDSIVEYYDESIMQLKERLIK